MDPLLKGMIKYIRKNIKRKKIRKFIKNPILKAKRVFYVLYLNRILPPMKGNYTPESLINFVFKYGKAFFQPIQVKSEILDLITYLRKFKPKYILEIGTASGATLFLFTKIAEKDATIISIDLPGGEFGGGYPEWKIPIFKKFSSQNQQLHLIRMDSHKEETIEKAKQHLNQNLLDILFIDGDHSYLGVKKDFEMYHSLVKNQGKIIFHDITSSKWQERVYEFWNEIKTKYDSIEIVEEINQNLAGIGILHFK